jgi:hypothetical protein
MVLNILIWVSLAVVFGALVFSVVWFRSFSKIRAEITDLTNNGRKTYYDKVRSVKDKKGRSGWQFFKTKSLVGGKSKVISEPPYKYVDLLDSGVKFVRFVKIGDELHPWHPDFEVSVENNSDDELVQKLKGVKTEALGTNEREAYLYEMQRASQYGSTGWKDLLTSAMPFITMLIVILGGVIMFDSMGDRMVEIQDKIDASNARSETIQRDTAQALERVAEILGEGNSGSSVPSGGVPN